MSSTHHIVCIVEVTTTIKADIAHGIVDSKPEFQLA